MSNSPKINLHTHSTFCDGKNTPEEIVLQAIQKGFTTIGFSGHSLFPFARDWHIAPRDFSLYEETINTLKEKYKNDIQILLGYEADFFPAITSPSHAFYNSRGLSPDYLIGSVHYIVTPKGFYSVDNETSIVRKKIIELYSTDGTFESVDGKQVVKDYFETERKMLVNADFDILGHADLIRLRNTELHYFDENEDWYLQELESTAEAIAKSGVVVEINTGAISRGKMNDTYPSLPFLKILYSKKVPVCINSDAHIAENLDGAFDYAVQQARKAGYTELTYRLRRSSSLAQEIHIKA